MIISNNLPCWGTAQQTTGNEQLASGELSLQWASFGYIEASFITDAKQFHFQILKKGNWSSHAIGRSILPPFFTPSCQPNGEIDRYITEPKKLSRWGLKPHSHWNSIFREKLFNESKMHGCGMIFTVFVLLCFWRKMYLTVCFTSYFVFSI